MARAEDQGYTYQELRDTITDLLADSNTLGIIALINPTNLAVVENCAPGLIGSEDQQNTKSLRELWSDYDTLKKALDVAVDADEVLGYFTSSNAGLAFQSSNIEDALLSYESYSATNLVPFLTSLDTIAILKDDDVC